MLPDPATNPVANVLFAQVFAQGNIPIIDMGPGNFGIQFAFHFPQTINFGENCTFNMYYGVASNLTDAQRVLQSVGAEIYALAKQSSNGACSDSNDMFIMAFNGIGGTPVTFNLPATAMPSLAPSNVPSLVQSQEPSFKLSVGPSSKPSPM